VATSHSKATASNRRKVNMVRRHRTSMAARLKDSMELPHHSKATALLDSISSHRQASMVNNHLRDNTDNHHLQDSTVSSHLQDNINLRLVHHQASMVRPRHKVTLELHHLKDSTEHHLLKDSSARLAVLAGHQRSLLSAMVPSK
jgi:hypothetical protein